MTTDGPLYGKYRVERVDGADRHPYDEHFGCDYFVLDLTHDPAAPYALLAYATQIDYTHPTLAAELGNKAWELLGKRKDAR